MSDNITDENFDKIHEAIDTTITTLEDSGSELGDIALCMFVEGANILEQMGLSKEEASGRLAGLSEVGFNFDCKTHGFQQQFH